MLAEARGKAQADSPRKTRSETPAYRLRGTKTIEKVLSTDLRPGDRVVVTAGQVIPSDGEVIEGIASVNESAITGESAPVIRESGGDRSGVTGGTTVISDRIVVKVRTEIEQVLQADAFAPLDGLVGEKMINVLQVNLELTKRYGAPQG